MPHVLIAARLALPLARPSRPFLGQAIRAGLPGRGFLARSVDAAEVVPGRLGALGRRQPADGAASAASASAASTSAAATVRAAAAAAGSRSIRALTVAPS